MDGGYTKRETLTVETGICIWHVFSFTKQSKIVVSVIYQ